MVETRDDVIAQADWYRQDDAMGAIGKNSILVAHDWRFPGKALNSQIREEIGIAGTGKKFVTSQVRVRSRSATASSF